MSDTFGFDEFVDSLNSLDEEMNKAGNTLLEEVGDLAVAETQTRTPVDTGTLRRSFARGDASDLKIEIGSSIEYAEFIEEGTRYMSGRHMLRNGATIAGRHLEKRAPEVVKEVLSRFKL